ncbi:MAG: HIT family protein [Patescibacteria group bacterium]
MSECILCDIRDKKIPMHIIAESETTVTFLERSPDTTGHTVVAPKIHGETILDFEDMVLAAVARDVKHAVERLETALHPEGFTIGWNHGAAGGQGTPHLHIHILPRWHSDQGGTIHSVVRQPSRPVEEIAALLL